MNEIIIKPTPEFERKAQKLMTAEAIEELFDHLLMHPEEGKVISGTGGVRKLRWYSGLNDRGKSGGVRVIYHYSNDLLIVLITLYAKSGKENLTRAERNTIKKLLPALIAKYKGEL